MCNEYPVTYTCKIKTSSRPSSSASTIQSVIGAGKVQGAGNAAADAELLDRLFAAHRQKWQHPELAAQTVLAVLGVSQQADHQKSVHAMQRAQPWRLPDGQSNELRCSLDDLLPGPTLISGCCCCCRQASCSQFSESWLCHCQCYHGHEHGRAIQMLMRQTP